MRDYCKKKSGEIPAFGNWDYVNDLPITQYFESARAAGLLRYTSSEDSPDFKKPPHKAAPPKNGGCVNCQNPRETQHKRKPSNLELSAIKTKAQSDEHYIGKVKIVNIVAKRVDEDLYKIPPDLLRTSKKRKVLMFFKRCLLPSCLG